MEFFEKYVSNCTAGMGTQSFFITEDRRKIYTSRAFYKPTVAGRNEYSFLFSNITDSTYSDGSHSRCNRIIDEWYIDEAKVCVCRGFGASGFVPVTFDGRIKKTVMPGELFASDGVTLSPSEGEYICIEISFHGNEIPYHPETLIPVFSNYGNTFVESKNMPLPAMIGCKLASKHRIAFLGDSITQGIGTTPDSYRHYASIAAGILGNGFSYWNIGIGYGRAFDAATNGIWAFKAKQNDIVTVCFGVNDIYQTKNSPKYNLERIVDILKESGAKVIIQTVPPFDYDSFHKSIWDETNAYIKDVIRPKCDGFLDVTEFLSESEENPEKPKFGGHPNDEGNEIWGKRLASVIDEVISKQSI